VSDTKAAPSPIGPIAVWWSVAAFALRYALAFIFLLAAWTKLQVMLAPGPLAVVGVPGPVNFREAIEAYQMSLPTGLVHWATYAIPFTEVLVGVCLLLGLWVRGASLVFILLMGVFLYGILSVLNRGMSIHCGCFGRLAFFCDAAEPISWCKVRENIGFASAAALLLLFGGGRASLDALVRRA